MVLLELFVVLHEVLEVVVGHVDIGVSTQPAMLFHSLATSAEGIAVDLVLNLIGCVGEQDRALDHRGGHLALGSLQRREEFGVHQSRLGVLELLRHVAGEAEVRVLVNGAGDEARDVVCLSKDLREGVGERRRSLDADKVTLANIVRVVEAKRAFALVVGDGASDLQHILVERATVIHKVNQLPFLWSREFERGAPHVVQVAEDKGLLKLEAACNDILCVLQGVLFDIFNLER